jgi:hypothetical protein
MCMVTPHELGVLRAHMPTVPYGPLEHMIGPSPTFEGWKEGIARMAERTLTLTLLVCPAVKLAKQ